MFRRRTPEGGSVQPVSIGRRWSSRHVIDVARPVQESPEPACRAPFTSLWLDNRGFARSCCMNHAFPLGRIGEQSLREIWDGQRTAALRRRLAASDFGLGCEQCGSVVENGDEEIAFFHNYETLPLTEDVPRWPTQLELSISNKCNLQCVMCEGEYSSMIRAHRERLPPLPEVYDDAFFEELDEFLPHLTNIVFMGGEPFLARPTLRVMERLIELGLTPECCIISNGTQWNDRIERILRELPVSMTISIDGMTAETVERIRVGVDFDQLTQNIDRYRRATTRDGRLFHFCYCLMTENWQEFGPLLEWADQTDTHVYVKRVTDPFTMSLEHASLDYLAACVESLESDDERLRSVLTTNRHVWEAELSVLRHMLHRRRNEDHLTHLPPPALTDAALFTEAGALGDGFVFLSDASHRVIDIRPSATDVWGADLSHLVGQQMYEIVPALSAAFGDLVESTVKRGAAGKEERRFEFDRAGTSTVLTAAPVDEGGFSWAVRRLGADEPSEAVVPGG